MREPDEIQILRRDGGKYLWRIVWWGSSSHIERDVTVVAPSLGHAFAAVRAMVEPECE